MRDRLTNEWARFRRVPPSHWALLILTAVVVGFAVQDSKTISDQLTALALLIAVGALLLSQAPDPQRKETLVLLRRIADAVDPPPKTEDD